MEIVGDVLQNIECFDGGVGRWVATSGGATGAIITRLIGAGEGEIVETTGEIGGGRVGGVGGEELLELVVGGVEVLVAVAIGGGVGFELGEIYGFDPEEAGAVGVEVFEGATEEDAFGVGSLFDRKPIGDKELLG